MSQFYFNPEREDAPYAPPDGETFYIDAADATDFAYSVTSNVHHDEAEGFVGWYWWPCFPGCLPDGEPVGPFDSEEEAIADAQGESS